MLPYIAILMPVYIDIAVVVVAAAVDFNTKIVCRIHKKNRIRVRVTARVNLGEFSVLFNNLFICLAAAYMCVIM